MIDWRERIVRDPDICHGKPCIKGTRIWPSTILGALASGLSQDEVTCEYEPITLDDIQATLSYAAQLAHKQERKRLRSDFKARTAKDLRTRRRVGPCAVVNSRARAVRQYFVYIMTNAARVLYVGVTNDLERRVYQHKRGTTPGFSARYRLTYLAHYEETNDVREAIAREKHIKGWTRARKIALIEGENPNWRDLSAGWL